MVIIRLVPARHPTRSPSPAPSSLNLVLSPPLGRSDEQLTQHPSLLVLVVSDGVVQLMAHGDLEGRDETLTKQPPQRFITGLKTKLYRIHGGNIRDPPPLPPRRWWWWCLALLKISPAHTAGRRCCSSPFQGHHQPLSQKNLNMLWRKTQHSHQRNIALVISIKGVEILPWFCLSDTLSKIFLHLLNVLYFFSRTRLCSRVFF